MNQDQNQNTATVKNPEEKTEKQMTADEIARIVSKGTIRLAQPIRASDKDIAELHFDFTKLTGWEFAQAMDRDESGKTNAFRLTERQALELFALTAAKETPDIDAEDIRHRMGIEDAIKAAQIAASFFNFTSRAANLRITR